MNVGNTFPISVVMIPTATTPTCRSTHSSRALSWGTPAAAAGGRGTALSAREDSDASSRSDMSVSNECGTRQKTRQATIPAKNMDLPCAGYLRFLNARLIILLEGP